MRTVLNSRVMLWFLLAIPAIVMAYQLWSGAAEATDLVPVSGIVSVRLMIAALAIGPLADLAGPRAWTRWLLARRRYFGFAAFLYALGHLALYVIDVGTVADMLAEITENGIWTGWAALAFLLLPGLTSTDAAMRALRRGWKRVQRAVYPAALLTLAHWGLLETRWAPALWHFGPLAGLHLARILKRRT